MLRESKRGQKRPSTAGTIRSQPLDDVMRGKLRPQSASSLRGGGQQSTETCRRMLEKLIAELRISGRDLSWCSVTKGSADETSQLQGKISTLLTIRSRILHVLRLIETHQQTNDKSIESELLSAIDDWRNSFPIIRKNRSFMWRDTNYEELLQQKHETQSQNTTIPVGRRGSPIQDVPIVNMMQTSFTSNEMPPLHVDDVSEPIIKKILPTTSQLLAAIRIQSVYRGYLSRCRATYQKMRVAAAIKIQKLQRRIFSKQRVLWWRELQRLATLIQSGWRGYQVRRMLKRRGFVINNAIQIQSLWRGHLTRRKLEASALERRALNVAASQVAIAWKRSVWRIRTQCHSDRRSAQIAISAVVRGHLTRSRLQGVRRIEVDQIDLVSSPRSPSPAAVVSPLMKGPMSPTVSGNHSPGLPSNIIILSSADLTPGEWLVCPPAPEDNITIPAVPEAIDIPREKPQQLGMKPALWISTSPSPLKLVSVQPSCLSSPVSVLSPVQWYPPLDIIIKVQQFFRLMLAIRRVARQRLLHEREKAEMFINNEIEMASILIQVRVRIMLAKKQLNQRLKNRIAATAIQIWWRDASQKLVNIHTHEDSLLDDSSKVNIASTQKRAAKRIETCMTAHLATKRIKQQWIDYFLQEEEKLNKVVHVQRWWLAVTKYVSESHHRTIVQNRMKHLAKRKEIQSDAVLVIQSVWRGYLHRKQRTRLRAKNHALRILSDLRIEAALIIQRSWRRVTVKSRYSYLRQNHNNLMSEILFREMLVENVIKIQSLIRGSLTRKHLSESRHAAYVEQFNSAIDIQRIVRGFLVRQYLATVKTHIPPSPSQIQSLRQQLLADWPTDFPYPLGASARQT